ncbi:MAG: FAD-binding oxidoreductase, partial [Williamsia herbipolensis]|nr:FAD-binding oxidoreductase [Williamsia herbipolensis]
MSNTIIVVGAGVIGASTAFQLATSDRTEVVVLDIGPAGGGMSSRSSALVRMHYAFEPEVRLAVESLAMFRDWPQLTGRPDPVRPCPFLRFVQPGEQEALRHNVAMQQACGAETELVDADRVRELEPGWVVDDAPL